MRVAWSWIGASTPLMRVWCVVAMAGWSAAARGDDWPQWRGPGGNNHADRALQLPVRWNLATGQNVAWKTALPGTGHSPPIVVADGIFMTSLGREPATQSLLKLDRRSGRLMDRWVVHRGGRAKATADRDVHALPSPASDGERIFVSFRRNDAVWVTAMTPEGTVAWRRRVAGFEPPSSAFACRTSPIVAGDLLIVAAESASPESGLYALDVRTGQPVWQSDRPRIANLVSPIAATIAGRRQVLLAGGEAVSAYDPQTGREIWSHPAGTETMRGTIAWDDRRVMLSGGQPDAGTWCVRAAGPKKLLWQNRVSCDEHSLLTINDYAFAVADDGVAYCWRTRDGKEMWRAQLFDGGIRASPLLVDREFVVGTESGEVFTIAAIPDRFVLRAENRVGERIVASPIAVDGRLYVRTTLGENDDAREFLVAIGIE